MDDREVASHDEWLEAPVTGPNAVGELSWLDGFLEVDCSETFMPELHSGPPKQCTALGYQSEVFKTDDVLYIKTMSLALGVEYINILSLRAEGYNSCNPAATC